MSPDITKCPGEEISLLIGNCWARGIPRRPEELTGGSEHSFMEKVLIR
jgi:hypothetical protein